MTDRRQDWIVGASAMVAVFIGTLVSVIGRVALTPVDPGSRLLLEEALDVLRRSDGWIGLGAIGVALASMLVLTVSAALRILPSLLIRHALGAPRRSQLGLLIKALTGPALVGCVCGLAAGLFAIWPLRASWPALLSRQSLLAPMLAAAALVTAAIMASLLLTAAVLVVIVEGGLAGRTAGLAGDHVTPGRAMTRTQSVLVALQLAMLLAVAYGAALLLRNSTRLAGPGAPRTNQLVARVSLESVASRAARAAMLRRWLGQLGPRGRITSPDAIIELGRRTAVSGLCNGCFLGNLPLPSVDVRLIAVSPPFPLGGAGLAAGDTLGARPAAVLNRVAADTVFPEGHAVSSELRVTWDSAGRYVVRAIVPTAAPRALGNRVNEPRLAFVSVLQDPPAAVDVIADSATLRGLQERPALGRVEWVQTVNDRLRLFAQPLDWSSDVATLIAALAICWAAFGLVVLSGETVRARRREIATRMAVGAGPMRIRRWVLGRSLRATTAGVLVGLPAARAIGVMLRELPNQSNDNDVWLLLWVTALLVVLGAAASWRAGARAAAIPPAALGREP